MCVCVCAYLCRVDVARSNCSSSCGGKLRDTIIHFGDMLPEDQMERAERHAQQSDLMISLGSTMLVTPANELVTRGHRKRKHGLVIANRQATGMLLLALGVVCIHQLLFRP